MVEQVFERRSKKVNDENIVKALLAKVIDIRYTSYYLSARFDIQGY